MLERSSIVNSKKKKLFRWQPIDTFPRLMAKLPRRKRRKFLDVTVCIAAICERNIILGAADRMITSGDIEFEPSDKAPVPPVFKIEFIMNSITAMTAGDSGFQSEAMLYVRAAIWAQIHASPTVWPTVRDAVGHYIDFYNQKKLREAEAKFLLPFDLDRKSFRTEQKEMAPKVAAHLTAEMIGYDVEYEVETIFTGVDDTGAHIYQLRENEYMSCDSVGFAAIGSGGRHAESQFMLARHSRTSMLDETLYLIHHAKKQSEIAPGVGEATDMFTIGPQKGTFAWLGGTAWPKPGIINMARLDAIYDSAQDKRAKIIEESKREMKSYVDEIRSVSEKVSKDQPIGKTDARVAASGVSTSVTAPSVATEKKSKRAPRKSKKRSKEL